MTRPITPHRLAMRGASALFATAWLLAACGGGGFPAVETPSTVGNDLVLAGFETGTGALVVADETGTANPTAALVERASAGASEGSAAVKVTLSASTALVGLAADGGGLASDWTGFRTLMVDLTSSQALEAGAVKLVTKAGASYKWCVFTNNQALVANTATTVSFRLDWPANPCGATAQDVATIKYAYVSLPGGAGNVLHLDNLRLTKSVRVMALGDSITGSPGCWRQALWADTLAARTAPPVDMVGVRNNASECATALARGWDADNAGFGGMRVRSVGSSMGLADASRSDSVAAASGVTVVPGNLPVWLERTRPDLMMVHLGTNDVWNGTATDAIVAGLDKLVDQARDSHAGMRFVVAQIPLLAPSGCTTDCPTRAAALNAAVAAWAQCKRSAASPITLADLTVGWNTATHTSDGVHPNAAGATVMAANWKAAVAAALDSIDTAGPGPASGCMPANVSDRADGSTQSGVYTITSFKTGVAALTTLNNDGSTSAATQATLALDTSGTRATEGSLAARFTVLAAPSGGWVSAAQTGNGGQADWSAYRYLKFDVVTAETAFSGALYFQSGSDWSKWCQSEPASIDANSRGTLTMDLAACGAVDLKAPQRFGLVTWNPGTYYLDHVRLEPAAAAAEATDVADGSLSNAGFTITSFKTGTSSVTLLNNDGTPSSSSQATLAHDTSGNHGTEGSYAAVFSVINPPAGGSVAIGHTNNGGLADWSAYRTLSFDVVTGDAAFSGLVVLQSGSGWNWCQGEAVTIAANGRGTVSLDLRTCSGGDLTQPQRFQMFSWNTGTFYVDNIRLGH